MLCEKLISPISDYLQNSSLQAVKQESLNEPSASFPTVKNWAAEFYFGVLEFRSSRQRLWPRMISNERELVKFQKIKADCKQQFTWTFWDEKPASLWLLRVNRDRISQLWLYIFKCNSSVFSTFRSCCDMWVRYYHCVVGSVKRW